MKKTISVFLIIAVMIFNVNIYYVQAETNWFAVLTNAADVYVNTATPTEQSTLQLINDFLQTNGFASAIANSVSPVSDDIIKYFSSQIDASQANKTLQENIEAIRECVENGFTGGDSSVTFNNTLHNAIYNTANYYVEDNTINIWYCCSVQASSSNDLVNGFLEDAVPIMDEFKNNAYYLLRTSNSGTTYFYVIPKVDCMIYGVQSSVFSNQWHGFNLYRCKDISGVITYEPILVRDSLCTVYLYGSDGHLTLINDHSIIDQGYAESPLGAYYYYQAGHGTEGHDFLRYPKGISKYGDTLETFLSTNALDTYIHSIGVGLQPYYYNNQVWSNFSKHTSGDYTVDYSNVNTVTYGDVVSYVNDYYDTNNNYPDNSTVNNWINTTNNNNTGGESGGGSGGSGDDSGGSGIVSILTALGKAIAELITGIASFLAEVVGGLVEAITGLLDTLTDLITNFTESIPNIFSPLLGWLFDGLPEEFTAIILLGLSACVIASIIKILRG